MAVIAEPVTEAPRGLFQTAVTERMVSRGVVIMGRYELQQMVDRDELRTRFLASDLWLSRTVLVDVYSSRIGIDDHIKGRILQRLSRIAQLRHSSAPRLLDGGLDEQIGAFIVTEPVPAPTLRSVLQRSDQLVRSSLAKHAITIARTLQEAHNRGLFHGRLSAGNIHIDPVSERVWVLGWLDGAILPGTIRRLSFGRGSELSFLAPELSDTAPAGPAADMYGLGLVMQEMHTGQCPPARGHLPSQSSRLKPIIEKALDPIPGRRWPSTAALVSAIEAAAPIPSRVPAAGPHTSPPDPHQPLRSPGWMKRAITSGFAVGCALLAFILIAMMMSRAIGDMPLIKNGVALSVPSMLGKSVEEAQRIASEQDMELLVVGARESDRYPAGQILQQSPVPGWRPYDKQPIRVTVSAGVLVPDFVGKPFVDAAKQANQLGWKIARVEPSIGGSQPATTVLIQSPGPGSLVPAPGELALVIAQ